MNHKNKQLIIFDVDQTLTKSKADIEEDMAELLCQLLSRIPVAIISGGAFPQLKKQVADLLPCKDRLEQLFILPTSGSSLYTYKNGWNNIYASTLEKHERKRVIEAIKKTLDEVDIPTPPEIFGERIEDRGTQITFSGLGQEAPLELKKKWDPDRKKRKKIQKRLVSKLPDFDIDIGGSTSIDIKKRGNDKGDGVKRLCEYLSLPLSSVLFVGDALFEGGNDESVKDIGVESISVENTDETRSIINSLLKQVQKS